MLNEVYQSTEEKMQKTIASMLNDFQGIRAGRASASLLNGMTVSYYGVDTPINQLANISTPEPRLLIIQPYDKAIIKDICKVIQSSDIGINPQNDGNMIRMPFPPLTEERRREISKNIFKYSENAKVAIRNIRRDALDRVKTLKKNSDITEDDQKEAEKKIQDITDRYCEKIDKEASEKEKEIMEV